MNIKLNYLTSFFLDLWSAYTEVMGVISVCHVFYVPVYQFHICISTKQGPHACHGIAVCQHVSVCLAIPCC